MASLIDEHPSLVHDMMQTDPSDTLCQNDIGKAQCLQKWSRGHQFIVRGGGHNDAWQPLYRLEVNKAWTVHGILQEIHKKQQNNKLRMQRCVQNNAV